MDRIIDFHFLRVDIEENFTWDQKITQGVNKAQQ